MEITSKPTDYENRVYLEKISMLIREIDSTTDLSLFVQQMVSLSALLSNL